MKHKYLLLMLLLFTTQFVRSQNQNSHFLNDGEFDEGQLRKISISFGYSGDDLDSLMESQKINYLNLKEQSKNLALHPEPYAPAPPPVYYSCGAIPICTGYTLPVYPTIYPLYYNTTTVDHLEDEPDFFENVPAPLARWLGQLGGFISGTWLYDNNYYLDNYSYQIMTGKDIDPLGGFPMVAPGSQYSLRLGGPVSGAKSEKLIRKYSISSSPTDQMLTYKYAVVLQNPGHTHIEKPSFVVSLYAVDPSNGSLVEICCEKYEVYAGEDVPGFVASYPGVVSKPWATNVINLSDYYKCLVESADGPFYEAANVDFVLEFTVRDCTQGGHFGYAYIDGGILPPVLKKSGRLCKGHELTLSSDVIGLYRKEHVLWQFGDHPAVFSKVVDHMATDPGEIADNKLYITPKHTYIADEYPATFTCTLTVINVDPDVVPGCNKPIVITRSFTINDCGLVKGSCEECIQSFAPIPGEKYILSAWASQITSTVSPDPPNTHPDKLATYNKPNIQVKLNGPDVVLGPFAPSGLVIDGWQKIEAVVDIPLSTTSIEIILNNEVVENADYFLVGRPADVFFDDIRMSPTKANMKTFVYDPITQKLMAELDENNYATFYEYDEEGALIRVKKETAKGVSTIKETLSNTHKK